LQMMVGCMFEGPIGIAAGIHFIASTDNIILTDLDSDLEIQDTTNTKSLFENGQRSPLQEPGFGITLDKEKISKLEEKGEAIYEKII